jgi:hypothetical protein
LELIKLHVRGEQIQRSALDSFPSKRTARFAVVASAVQTSRSEVTGEAYGVCVCASIGLMHAAQVHNTSGRAVLGTRKNSDSARESIAVPAADRCRRRRRRSVDLKHNEKRMTRGSRNNAKAAAIWNSESASIRVSEFSGLAMIRNCFARD